MEMQFNEKLLIELFIDVDDFCNTHEKWKTTHELKKLTTAFETALKSDNYYHQSGYKCFEYYYKRLVLPVLKPYFPKIVGYKYFLSLIEKCFETIFLFLQWQVKSSEPTGIYYVDSKRLPVCHNRRIHSHKVFKDIAKRGKSSTGWFYGLKIHEFFENGLHIVTKVRKNMKNKLIPIQRKYELMKRGMIESVNDILMTVCDIEHTRHRKPINALVHMMTALVAYNYLDKKPTVIFKNLI